MEENIFGALTSTNINNKIISLDLRTLKLMKENAMTFLANYCICLKTLMIDTPNFFTSNNAVKFQSSLTTFYASNQSNIGVLKWLLLQDVTSINYLTINKPEIYSEEHNVPEVDTTIIKEIQSKCHIEEQFIDLLSQCLSLKSLDIAFNELFLTDKALDFISHNMSDQLISLNINGGGSFTDKSVSHMCISLVNLKTLKFNDCTTISFMSLLSIINGLPSLTQVNFFQKWYPNSTTLDLLWDKFSIVTHIDLKHCGLAGEPILRNLHIKLSDFIDRGVPQKYIRRQCYPVISNIMLNKICHSPKIIVFLAVASDVINGDGIKALIAAHGEHLDTLIFKDITKLSSETMLFISNHSFVKLAVLSLTFCPHILHDSIVLLLKSSPNLKFLDMHDMVNVKSSFCTDVGNYCSKLKQISLTGCQINVDSIKHMGDKCEELVNAHFAPTNHFLTIQELEKALSNCLKLMICSFSNVYCAVVEID
jgi:hypothetical protein